MREDYIFSKYNNPYDKGRIDSIKQLIENGYGRKALDVGSGPGILLKHLNLKKWITTVIDKSEKNIKIAELFTKESYVGDANKILELLIKKNMNFDLIIALELIEHLTKTKGKVLLENIKNLLNKNGVLIISTPNKLSLEGFGGYYINELIFNKKWNAWDKTHTYIYNSFQLKRLLKKIGFNIETIVGYYYEGDIMKNTSIRLPFTKSTKFPMNMFGFNTIFKCSIIKKP
jgi:2-polyprenyl-3-methyl-5-hydroxy-6-metoxy-1,4-benzoquinol methylase